jgi:hypothetical protein
MNMQNTFRNRRLATAGLAYNTEHPTAPNIKTDPIDGTHIAAVPEPPAKTRAESQPQITYR